MRARGMFAACLSSVLYSRRKTGGPMTAKPDQLSLTRGELDVIDLDELAEAPPPAAGLVH